MEPSTFRSAPVRKANVGVSPNSLRPIDPELTRPRVTGSRWELIGVLSHSSSTPRRRHGDRGIWTWVRFLDISVGAEPHDYAITIIVPFASDPANVLPRIESIV